MRVGLFIPCYVDQLFPDVGMATVEVLERFGVQVDFPTDQTCCGQPMYNSGFTDDARALARRHVGVFREYDHVVCPSASCVATVRNGYPSLVSASADLDRVVSGTFELCEFLTDVLGVDRVDGAFAERVGLHPSCHGLRELRLGASSELGGVGPRDRARALLESLRGIDLVSPSRPDECCGFGGTFAVDEAAVSCMMGRDRVRDHVEAGARVITATDMSCLAHLDGLIRRDRTPVRVMHVAEILAAAMRSAPETAP